MTSPDLDHLTRLIRGQTAVVRGMSLLLADRGADVDQPTHELLGAMADAGSLLNERALAVLDVKMSDADQAAVLLPAIADGPLVGRTFVASELVALDDDRVRSALRNLSCRQIGRLLARVEGRPYHGWTVRRSGEVREGHAWRLEPAG